MIIGEHNSCPTCGGELKYYDTVLRLVRTKNGVGKRVKIQRFTCLSCGRIHRRLPDYILPYKHYEAEIIRGVLEGIITSSTLGFEDYPCEMTMTRWKTQEKVLPFST